MSDFRRLRMLARDMSANAEHADTRELADIVEKVADECDDLKRELEFAKTYAQQAFVNNR